jgi:hypothetical protein
MKRVLHVSAEQRRRPNVAKITARKNSPVHSHVPSAVAA